MLGFPLLFWISLVVLGGVAFYGWRHRYEGWGIPAVAVCGTVAVWYHGDAFYNGYAEFHAVEFAPSVLEAAWTQVVLFAVAFGVLVPIVSRTVNARYMRRGSHAMRLIRDPRALDQMQPLLRSMLLLLAAVWGGLALIGLWRVDGDWQGMFFPYLTGQKANPWTRGRIGGGLDFLFALVLYVNLLCMAGFGIVAALANRFGTRLLALALMVLSWPSILLDRTRNTMLAIVLPGLLAYVFLRWRNRPMAQAALLLGGFLVVNTWLAFVVDNRSDASIASVLVEQGVSIDDERGHLGLNMFEELSWINEFMADGTYEPNWGRRYFAELVNPIPRSVWAGKPLIGIDYAIARGQEGGSDVGAGVHATISTGMIGQGVVNFGPLFGPIAAAFLMALWCAMLARFDLADHRLGRPILFALGLVLTFNLGRDITLLVAYPVFFGYAIFYAVERFRRRRRYATAPRPWNRTSHVATRSPR